MRHYQLVSQSHQLVLVLLMTLVRPVMPHLLDDMQAVLDKWGSSGTFDPFGKIYEVGVLIHTDFYQSDIPLRHSSCFS